MGTRYWLWYTSVVGFRKLPIGVFDHPPDPDFSAISAIQIGDSRAASFGHDVTSLINEVNDFLTHIPGT